MKDETPETPESLILTPNPDCEGDGEHFQRLSGQRDPLPAFEDDPDAVWLETFAFSIRRKPREGAALKIGGIYHAVRERKADRKGVFVRETSAISAVDPLTGTAFDVLVLHVRKWLLLLPLALCALLLALALRTCGTSHAPSLHYIDGQTQTEGAEPSQQPVASIEYASYEASVDCAIDQIQLALPATATHGGVTGKNPIDSSPSIYVDIDSDGDFDPSECVYNPPDSSGSGYGSLLRAGSRVDSIELTCPLDSGTYDAMTLWRSVLAGTPTPIPAGETAFAWTLTVY